MKQDVNEKYYLNDRYRIVDLLNGYFFHEVQYIAPEDVKDGGTQLVYVSEDLFMVMSSMSKNWQLRELQNEQDNQEKGRKVDMCKAIDDMLKDSRNDGLRIGREEGRVEGEERISKINRLNVLLISENRLDDLKRATQDKEFQNILL